jgi:hypothetical protein
VVVLVRVPEDVHLVESLAGDGAPEGLGVLDGSDLVLKLAFCPRSLLADYREYVQQRQSWDQRRASRFR